MWEFALKCYWNVQYYSICWLNENFSTYSHRVKFGVSLEQVCKNDIPGPLLVLILKLNKEGPSKKDVFRAPGHHGSMKKLVHFLQNGRLVNIGKREAHGVPLCILLFHIFFHMLYVSSNFILLFLCFLHACNLVLDGCSVLVNVCLLYFPSHYQVISLLRSKCQSNRYHQLTVLYHSGQMIWNALPSVHKYILLRYWRCEDFCGCMYSYLWKYCNTVKCSIFLLYMNKMYLMELIS